MNSPNSGIGASLNIASNMRQGEISNGRTKHEVHNERTFHPMSEQILCTELSILRIMFHGHFHMHVLCEQPLLHIEALPIVENGKIGPSTAPHSEIPSKSIIPTHVQRAAVHAREDATSNVGAHEHEVLVGAVLACDAKVLAPEEIGGGAERQLPPELAVAQVGVVVDAEIVRELRVLCESVA